MTRYYLTTIEAWKRNAHRFRAHHWSDLKNGKILLCAEIDDDSQCQAWEREKEVEALPHPFVQPDVKFTDSQIKDLKNLGIEKNDTMKDFLKKTAMTHSHMRVKSM